MSKSTDQQKEVIYKEIKKNLDNGEEVIINNLDRADKVILKKARQTKTEVLLEDVKTQIEKWKQVKTIEYRRDEKEAGQNYIIKESKIEKSPN